MICCCNGGVCHCAEEEHKEFFRGTTPTIRWYIDNEEFDFSNIAEIWITFEDKEKKFKINIIKDKIEINAIEKYIQYTFTQEQTLKFSRGMAHVQLRMLLQDGQALASTIEKIFVKDILKEGVIE